MADEARFICFTICVPNIVVFFVLCGLLTVRVCALLHFKVMGFSSLFRLRMFLCCLFYLVLILFPQSTFVLICIVAVFFGQSYDFGT